MTIGAKRKAQVAIVGAGSASAELERLAEAAGALVARRGAVLVTGGRGGVMAAAARGARAAGGTTVGILPSAAAADANEWCDIVLPTGLGHARNTLVALAGDCVIGVGGAAGTLAEVALAVVHARPVLVLAEGEGWPVRALQAGALGDAGIVACADLAELDERLTRLLAEVAR